MKTVNASGLDTNLYTTNEKPIDMASKMYDNFPQLAPLLAIFSRMADDSTSQSKVYWTESESLPDRIIVSADVAAAAANFTSAQYTYVRKWDLFLNPKTYEVLLVTARPTTSTITATKGWGASDDLAIDGGTTLIKIGNAYPESSEDTEPRQVKNTEFYNITQEIVKHTRHSSRVMNESTFFGGKGTKRTEANRKMLYDFRKELEFAILFGTLSDTDVTSGASGTGYTKTFSGIVEKLKNGTNYYNVDGVLTETKIDDWLTQIYVQFPDAKNLICVMPPRLYSRFNAIAKPLIRMSNNAKRYGMNLSQYDGAVTLDLIKHPLLTGPYLEEMMFVLDTDYMKLKWQKRPQLELDVAMKRYNYTEDKLSCFVTFMAALEARHAMAVGVKG